jgi:hypothetical protein
MHKIIKTWEPDPDKTAVDKRTKIMKSFAVRFFILTNLFLELLLFGMLLYRRCWMLFIILCVFMLVYHVKRFNRFLYIEYKPFIVIGQTKIDLSSISFLK